MHGDRGQKIGQNKEQGQRLLAVSTRTKLQVNRDDYRADYNVLKPSNRLQLTRIGIELNKLGKIEQTKWDLIPKHGIVKVNVKRSTCEITGFQPSGSLDQPSQPWLPYTPVELCESQP